MATSKLVTADKMAFVWRPVDLVFWRGPIACGPCMNYLALQLTPMEGSMMYERCTDGLALGNSYLNYISILVIC